MEELKYVCEGVSIPTPQQSTGSDIKKGHSVPVPTVQQPPNSNTSNSGQNSTKK